MWRRPSSAGSVPAHWPWPPVAESEQRRYGARQQLARCWLGRPALDRLSGHSAAAKACCLLPERGLLFTGGVDKVVRAWDLHSGIQLAASRRHGGTVRCLAADADLLASGSSDHAIRVWLRMPGSAGSGSGGSSGPPFDLAGERRVLSGHTGPVSALALSPDVLVSASWDCSIRVWDRRSLECVAAVHTGDWVYSLTLGGSLLAAACRTEVLLFSLAGSSLQRLGSLHCPARGDTSAAITALACTPDGRSVAVGTQCGSVWLAEVCADRASRSGASSSSSSSVVRELRQELQVAAEVAGLSWDHPWLAVADHSGTVSLHDLGGATPAGAAAVEGGGPGAAAGAVTATGSGSRRTKGGKQRSEAVSRHLYSASIGGMASGAQCVALAGSWAAAGLDCGSVITWDGSKGLQQMAAAAAAKQHKAAKRQQRQAAHQQRGSRRATATGSSSQPVGMPPRSRPRAQAGEPEPGDGQPCCRMEEAATTPGALGRSPSGRSLLGQPAGSRARVPPPLHPDVLAAASCRQQAWQVLGRGPGSVARAGGGAGGGSAGPSTLGLGPAPSPL